MPKIDVVQVNDLRAAANDRYDVSQPLPNGAFGVFGPEVPFGSPEYAAADARAISPAVKPPAEAIPGWRVQGSLWDTERFVARIPKRWNGRLVVAGTPAQRSEFANDLIWSDPLLARGYAYVCGNKSQGDSHVVLSGDARLEVGGVVMPRFFIPGNLGVAFWQHAPGNGFSLWMDEFFQITDHAQEAIEKVHGRAPEALYAVGLSNGGNQVRFALERSHRFAGGLSWNAVLWSTTHNLLRQLPQAVQAMQAGRPDELEAMGFPPDVRGKSGASLYARNFSTYWVVTAWLHAMIFDPQTSIPYGDVRDPAPAEGWNDNIGEWRLERSEFILERIGAHAHTGDIRTKLFDLASQYDHLLPPNMHFYPYGEMVRAAGKESMYRTELIPNAQHVDSWSEDPDFPTMVPGHPRVLEAFDELVKWVEG